MHNAYSFKIDTLENMITQTYEQDIQTTIIVFSENKTHDFEADFESFEGFRVEQKIQSLLYDMRLFGLTRAVIVIFHHDAKKEPTIIQINEKGRVLRTSKKLRVM